MITHHQVLLQKENEKLEEQNKYLQKLVFDAQEKVRELSVSLQRKMVNVMPSITVCNDLLETSEQKDDEMPSAGFASAGSVKLDAPALCLNDGPFIAAGQENGAISLWSAQQPDDEQNRNKTKNRASSSGTLFRFSTEQGMSSEPEKQGPLTKRSNPLIGHRGPVTSVKWFDDTTLSSVSLDSTLKLWDVTTAKYHSVSLECPAVSHTIIDGTFAIASCTNSIFQCDPKDPVAASIETSEIITAIQQTELGLLIGTVTGKLLMIDPRMWKPYQSIQLSPAFLPISKISGFSEVTVTCFDGVVRSIGNELPLFVAHEFVRAPTMGTIIGSCSISIASKDDFVVSGSTEGRAIAWSNTGTIQSLYHRGSTVFDCVPITSFVGSFITSDSSPRLTMYACSFNDNLDQII